MADDAEPMSAPDYGDDIDQGTFEQILEMDEDEGDREFSSSIVFGFFDQADQTFNQMQDALEAKDLEKLSQLGHFLKGSSATLGFTHVRDECEKIQHWGHGMDETGTHKEEREKCLRFIKASLVVAQAATASCKSRMSRFYGQ